MFNKLLSRRNKEMSLLVSYLKDIPAGDFKKATPFVVKNITDETITAQVKLADDTEYVTTKLNPGWNPELLIEIKNVTANTLQFGE